MRILFPTFLRVGSRECSVELGPAFGQFLPNGRIMDHRTTWCRHPLRCVGTTSTSVTITTSRLSISTPILKYTHSTARKNLRRSCQSCFLVQLQSGWGRLLNSSTYLRLESGARVATAYISPNIAPVGRS